MSSNDAWVMVGGIRGTPDAAAADLFQRMALACIPDTEMETPIDELRDLAGGVDAESLLTTLEVISHTTVSLIAAPEGWTCSGGSLVAWNVSGGKLRWRVSKHVHAAFADDDAPPLNSLLPFVGRSAKVVRAMRFYDLLYRSASRGRPVVVGFEDGLSLLNASGMRADVRRHVIEPAVTEVAIRAPFLCGIDIDLVRDRGHRGWPIQAFSFSASFRSHEAVTAFPVGEFSVSPLMVG
jgi:hypothetical protein